MSRVGFSAAWCGNLVVKAADAFRARHPDCEIQIQEMPLHDRFGPLRRRELDLQLTELPADESDITAGPTVFSEPRALAVPTGHPFAERESVSFEDLAHSPLITITGPRSTGSTSTLRTTPPRASPSRAASARYVGPTQVNWTLVGPAQANAAGAKPPTTDPRMAMQRTAFVRRERMCPSVFSVRGSKHARPDSLLQRLSALAKRAGLSCGNALWADHAVVVPRVPALRPYLEIERPVRSRARARPWVRPWFRRPPGPRTRLRAPSRHRRTPPYRSVSSGGKWPEISGVIWPGMIF